MNAIEQHAVDGGLGLSEPGEEGLRSILRPVGQVARNQSDRGSSAAFGGTLPPARACARAHDRGGGRGRRMRLPTDVELRCAIPPRTTGSVRIVSAVIARPPSLPHVLELHAGVDQCAEDRRRRHPRSSRNRARSKSSILSAASRQAVSSAGGSRRPRAASSCTLVAQDDVIRSMESPWTMPALPAGQNQVVVARRRIA